MFPHWVTPPLPTMTLLYLITDVQSLTWSAGWGVSCTWSPMTATASSFFPSYPLLGTVLELIWSLVGLNDSEEVSWVASILQIFQRRGKVRHWLVFSVWMGRSWDLNPGVIKLWIALPLTSPHCLMFLSRIDHTWLWRCWRIKSHYSRRVLWVRGLPLHL